MDNLAGLQDPLSGKIVHLNFTSAASLAKVTLVVRLLDGLGRRLLSIFSFFGGEMLVPTEYDEVCVGWR